MRTWPREEATDDSSARRVPSESEMPMAKISMPALLSADAAGIGLSSETVGVIRTTRCLRGAEPAAVVKRPLSVRYWRARPENETPKLCAIGSTRRRSGSVAFCRDVHCEGAGQVKVEYSITANRAPAGDESYTELATPRAKLFAVANSAAESDPDPSMRTMTSAGTGATPGTQRAEVAAGMSAAAASSASRPTHAPALMLRCAGGLLFVSKKGRPGSRRRRRLRKKKKEAAMRGALRSRQEKRVSERVGGEQVGVKGGKL